MASTSDLPSRALEGHRRYAIYLTSMCRIKPFQPGVKVVIDSFGCRTIRRRGHDDRGHDDRGHDDRHDDRDMTIEDSDDRGHNEQREGDWNRLGWETFQNRKWKGWSVC